MLDTAVHDPLGGGLVLRDARDDVERLHARLSSEDSPWTGALAAVCVTLGSGPSEPSVFPDARQAEEAPAPIRVFLLDDHEVVRRGLRDILSSSGQFEIVGESGSAARATAIIPALRPDVAVLDARLPDGSGMEVCRDIRSVDPGIRALILTSYDDDDALFTAILAGAAGYVLKQASSKELVDAVRLVAAGRSLIDPTLTSRVLDRLRSPAPEVDALVGITDREREILELIADGMTNRQIGEQLCLAEKTVKNYVSTLLGKFGLERRTQAAVLATRLRH
ncbi:response regulator transcription factor [Nocardioides daeguensis]|nr:response regulator transcription factor [Nocardioides daeguensis]MCR1773171.1 response regulator transcription factor [Nocardioides daeguensis]